MYVAKLFMIQLHTYIDYYYFKNLLGNFHGLLKICKNHEGKIYYLLYVTTLGYDHNHNFQSLSMAF